VNGRWRTGGATQAASVPATSAMSFSKTSALISATCLLPKLALTRTCFLARSPCLIPPAHPPLPANSKPETFSALIRLPNCFSARSACLITSLNTPALSNPSTLQQPALHLPCSRTCFSARSACLITSACSLRTAASACFSAPASDVAVLMRSRISARRSSAAAICRNRKQNRQQVWDE